MKRYLGISAVSMLLGTFASAEELFLENAQIARIERSLTELPVAVRPGLCQVFEDRDLYDLKPFDNIRAGGDANAEAGTPVTVPVDGGDKFMYRMCSGSWEMTADNFKAAAADVTEAPASCAGSAEAFLIQGKQCIYQFNDVTLTGIEDPSAATETERNIGFALEFKSQKKCNVQADENKKFKFTIKAYCADKVDGVAPEGKWSTESDGSDKCATTIRYDGPEACDRYTLEIEKYLGFITPYLGFILIVAGLALAFAGAKLILHAFTFLTFLGVTGLLFMVAYNLMPAGSMSPMILGVLLAVAAVAGGLVAWFTKKFADEWAMALLAAWGGVVVGLIIAKMAGIQSGIACLAMAVGGGLLGGYLGRKMNHVAKCIGAAFVGSFLVVRGVGMFAPKGYAYPSEFEMSAESLQGATAQTAIWLYLGGLVVLTVVGTLVQAYLFRDDSTDKDDMFDRQEEGRVCGCF